MIKEFENVFANVPVVRSGESALTNMQRILHSNNERRKSDRCESVRERRTIQKRF